MTAEQWREKARELVALIIPRKCDLCPDDDVTCCACEADAAAALRAVVEEERERQPRSPEQAARKSFADAMTDSLADARLQYLKQEVERLREALSDIGKEAEGEPGFFAEYVRKTVRRQLAGSTKQACGPFTVGSGSANRPAREPEQDNPARLAAKGREWQPIEVIARVLCWRNGIAECVDQCGSPAGCQYGMRDFGEDARAIAAALAAAPQAQEGHNALDK
jgi:hypothetical protein